MLNKELLMLFGNKGKTFALTIKNPEIIDVDFKIIIDGEEHESFNMYEVPIRWEYEGEFQNIAFYMWGRTIYKIRVVNNSPMTITYSENNKKIECTDLLNGNNLFIEIY